MKSDVNGNIKSGRLGIPLRIMGFVILFLIYHIPEFLQDYYQKPLIPVLELGMLFFAGFAFYFGLQWHRNGFRIYGLFSFRNNWSNLIKGLLVGILVTSAANLIPVLLHWSEISVHAKWSQFLSLSLLFALGTLLPSLAEDILTRGYLKAFWPKRLNFKWLIVISATVYMLNHILRLTKPDVMIYLFILGVLLMWCYVATGTLWLTLGIHWGSNIAYQSFTNLVIFNSIKETGIENYILAACYAFAFLFVIILNKVKLFSFETNNEITV